MASFGSTDKAFIVTSFPGQNLLMLLIEEFMSGNQPRTFMPQCLQTLFHCSPSSFDTWEELS
jgi:hypothetical protein